MKKNIKKIISFIIVFGTLSTMISIPTSATQISLAISPSKLYDKQIDIGKSEDFQFSMTNNSVTDDNSNFPLEVSISGEINDKYGQKIENDNILSFNKIDTIINSNNTDTVDVKINVPNDLAQGSYIAYIVFTQENTSTVIGNVGIQKNAIKVPIYFFAGSKDDYSNKKVSYTIDKNYISFENEEPTTLSNEISNNFKKITNPLNIPFVLKDIYDRPFYNIEQNGEQILDINNDIYTSLKNVTTTKTRTSDTNYVYYKKDWLSKKIERSKIGVSSIEITLEDGNIVSIKGKGNSIQYIQNQISNIAKTNNNIDLNYLFNNLQVPKNINYEQAIPNLATKITSTSEIPITLQGEFSTIKNNTENLFNKTITSPTIKPNETININNSISDKDLSEGKYNINGELKIRDESNNINYSFEIKKERMVIFGFIIIASIIYLAIILLLISILIKFLKKYLIKFFLKNKH